MPRACCAPLSGLARHEAGPFIASHARISYHTWGQSPRRRKAEAIRN